MGNAPQHLGHVHGTEQQQLPVFQALPGVLPDGGAVVQGFHILHQALLVRAGKLDIAVFIHKELIAHFPLTGEILLRQPVVVHLVESLHAD